MVQLAKTTEHSFDAWKGAADTNLFKPLQLGKGQLNHRIVLAPLTRVRNHPETGVPGEWSAEYYRQRSSKGGLLIAEATAISPEAGGIKGIPGIWTKEQVQGWKAVVEAVHQEGGQIWLQLWFQGRVADPKVVSTVWSPGTIPATGCSQDVKQLQKTDIERLLQQYRTAAENSIEAGFDGVELHGANGDLIDQFLQTRANNRTDEYGGSIENRIRFPAQVMKVLTEVLGEERTGIRVSPFSTFQDMREEHPLETFVPWIEHLVQHHPKLAYIHLVQPRVSGSTAEDGSSPDTADDTVDPLRDIILKQGKGQIKVLAAGNFDPKSAAEHAEKYPEDSVVFGRLFISNPDLPDRIRHGHPLRHYDRSTFYTQGAEGYIDQPTYEQEKKLGSL